MPDAIYDFIRAKKRNMEKNKSDNSRPAEDEQEEKKDKKSKDKSKDLKKENKRLKEKLEEEEERYQRVLADYHNLLKRQAREKEELTKYSNEKLIQEIIPVFDNLKISLKHTDSENNDSKWVEGVRYVVKQFREVLNNNGVEEIKTKGKKFDPNIMEALEGQGEKVKKEIKPGYTLHGKVIIPAKVVLEKGDSYSKEKNNNKK